MKILMNLQKTEDYCSLVQMQTRLGLFICIFGKEYTINFGKFYFIYKLFTKDMKTSYLVNVPHTLHPPLPQRGVLCPLGIPAFVMKALVTV